MIYEHNLNPVAVEFFSLKFIGILWLMLLALFFVFITQNI